MDSSPNIFLCVGAQIILEVLEPTYVSCYCRWNVILQFLQSFPRLYHREARTIILTYVYRLDELY